MIRKLMRSTVAIAGFGALLFVGACSSSTPGDSAVVDDQAEVRPFTEGGYDATQSAPEQADANNDGVIDTSTQTPRQGSEVTTTVITAEGAESSTSLSYETDPSATASSSTTVTETTVSPMTSSTTETTQVTTSTPAPLTTTTTTTETTTTESMTSSDTDETTATRTRLRKD
jgi:hypothetical protein